MNMVTYLFYETMPFVYRESAYVFWSFAPQMHFGALFAVWNVLAVLGGACVGIIVMCLCILHYVAFESPVGRRAVMWSVDCVVLGILMQTNVFGAVDWNVMRLMYIFSTLTLFLTRL